MTVAAVLLIGGIVWSIPMQTGQYGPTPATPRYAANAPPTFSIALTRAALIVTGHTTSLAHERQLRAAAARHFPDRVLVDNFLPLGLAPDWWPGATATLLETLAGVDAPRASLTEDMLEVRGIAADPAQVETRFRAVRDGLPEGTRVDVRLTDVDTDTSIATLCHRELRTKRFAPVYFDESGTRMRASAVPVLEQVVAFADACRNTTIAITGHTDSSGDERYNQALSLSRAQFVADWLQERGIGADRLDVTGAGSLLPIADNATRYGRSLNRRIDIEFSVTSPE